MAGGAPTQTPAANMGGPQQQPGTAMGGGASPLNTGGGMGGQQPNPFSQLPAMPRQERKVPDWVQAPEPGTMTSQALVELTNPATGEKFMAPSGGYSVRNQQQPISAGGFAMPYMQHALSGGFGGQQQQQQFAPVGSGRGSEITSNPFAPLSEEQRRAHLGMYSQQPQQQGLQGLMNNYARFMGPQMPMQRQSQQQYTNPYGRMPTAQAMRFMQAMQAMQAMQGMPNSRAPASRGAAPQPAPAPISTGPAQPRLSVPAARPIAPPSPQPPERPVEFLRKGGRV